MSLTSNFVAVIVSAITAFSSGYADVNISPAPAQSNTKIAANVDNASSVAQSANMAAGIAVIDRARKNYMATNSAELSHQEFSLQSLGRLPILLYAIRTDPQMVNNASDAIQMMESSSGEATDRMWKKYGGQSIIRDTAKRYVLEQTKPGNTWKDTTSTAVDIARMYRRFLDDKSVTIPQKKWVMTVLRKTSPSIVGEDFSWGLPNALGVASGTTGSRLGWVQGYSPSGSDPMIRASTGVVSADMRYIVVIIGQTVPATSDSDANRIINDVASSVTDKVMGTDVSSGSDDADVRAFQDRQSKDFGDFAAKQ